MRRLCKRILLVAGLALLTLDSRAEQLVAPKLQLENPFPPPPSTEETQALLDSWEREDMLTKLNKVLSELTAIRAELRRLRKAQCPQ